MGDPGVPEKTENRLDQLIGMLQSGRISRRQFVARSAALGVSMAGITTLLAACAEEDPIADGDGDSDSDDDSAGDTDDDTSDDESDEEEEDDQEDPDETDDEDGTDDESDGDEADETSSDVTQLVISMSQSPSSLDPAFGINAPEYSINSWIFDNLTRLTTDLELEPMVATEWSSNDDASEWTFTLREDVTFTNGRGLVADDVEFSISRILDEDTGSPGQTGLGPIDTVEADGDYTVRFTLSSPHADFPLELTQRWARIVPEEAVDNLESEPVGSGPFMLKEFVAGSHVVVERNEDHWDPDAATVDEIRLNTYPDEVAEITALQNGETHIMFNVPVASYDQVSELDGVNISQVSTGTWVPLVMRVDTEPFDDPRVREAIKYCMDREAFIDTVLYGQGTVGNDHNVPPSHPFFWESEPRERDLDRARELLEEAGYPDGFEFELVAATDRSIRADTAVTIQEMVREVGIELSVETIDYDTYIAQVYRQAPLYIGYWGMRPTLDGQMVPFFTTDGSFNEYAYSNEELDDILFSARSELDEDARSEMYQEAQQILSEEGPALIPYFLNVTSAYRDEVEGFEAHPLTSFDMRYVSLNE